MTYPSFKSYECTGFIRVSVIDDLTWSCQWLSITKV